MALDFPNAPTPGQVFGKWTWDGAAWVLTPGSAVPPSMTIPTGIVWSYAGTALPAGWLWCDGSTYTDVAQAKLSAAIGRTFTAAGVAAGSFQVPDLRKRAPMGADAGEAAKFGLGVKGGQRDSELAAHAHTVFAHGHAIQGNTGNDLANHGHDIGGLLTGTDNAPHSHNSLGGISKVLWWDEGGYNSGYAIPLVQNAGNVPLSIAAGAMGGPTAGHSHTLIGATGGPSPNHVHSSGTLAIVTHPDAATQSTKSPVGGTTYTDINLSPYLAVNFIIYTGN